MTCHERELGLGLQTNKRPGEYATLARIAEAGGFDVVTTFNDLWFQPALPALLAKQRELAAGDWLEQDNLVACPDPDERTIMRI